MEHAIRQEPLKSRFDKLLANADSLEIDLLSLEKDSSVMVERAGQKQDKVVAFKTEIVEEWRLIRERIDQFRSKIEGQLLT